MEKRKKDHKLAQEPDTNDLSNKEDQNQNVALVGKNIKAGSPSNEHTTSENNQHPPIVQWPYAPQNADQSPLASKPPIPTQSHSPIIISQWNFPHQHQQSLTNHQVQQGQLPLNYTQSTPPFWLTQRNGLAFSGMNLPVTFPPFVPFGGTEVTWQAPAVGGGNASTTQPQVSSFCYPFGYSFSGLPGPCDPLSLWGQAQQPQPPCTYAFPGTCNYFSSTPSITPSSSASSGQFFQRGIIRPPIKLSQKHQQLWDAQSAENVQLWNVINQLQSEIADYRSRLSKLEAEVSSFKPKMEEPSDRATGTALASQPSKRGRPKKSVASVDAAGSPAESLPRARGRKPATSKLQSDIKAHIFEKVVLHKVEGKDKACLSTAIIEQGNNENMSCNAVHAGGNVEINGNNLMMPAFTNQAHLQMFGIGLAPSLEIKSSDDKESKTAYSILSQQATVMNTKSSSAAYMSATISGNLGWSTNVTSEESGRNMLSKGSQVFYDNGSVIRQEGKLIPGWSFVTEEDASEELEDAVIGSTKDENDEMEEDASSGAEDISQTKDDGAYNVDGAVRTSPKGLPTLNNW
ncbi:hypothetical protein TorRG33x02_119560 [Trema orientale]|uniref:Uncharacterized protein n=1 Tax=Trema orientale TaxID=63057 RepID=A0A2P5F2V9_TREOI|nr:hypothetical protein TorRG33x02_119560 [Trema orientale]